MTMMKYCVYSPPLHFTPTSYFLQAMNSIFDVAGKTPLLTAEEEVALSKRIEAGDSAARAARRGGVYHVGDPKGV